MDCAFPKGEKLYRLTPSMAQSLRQFLETYHSLFTAGRCSGWELEELIVRSIRSDNRAQHHAFWKEAGHDTEADIRVRINGAWHDLQIKSGQFSGDSLVLSGHRLGRFDGDLGLISEFLNDRPAEIIAVPYRCIDDEEGRKHAYRVVYIDPEHLTGVRVASWKQKGKQWVQTNSAGVQFSLRPTMSWQIWWTVPGTLLEGSHEFTV